MIKQSIVFFLILSILLTGEYLFLRSRYRANFSTTKLETMLSTTSTLKDQTSDPCKYSILGEPPLPPNQYLKLHLNCPSGKSLNTLDPRAIPTLTYQGALEELGRINGFKVEFVDGEPTHFNCTGVKDYRQTVSIPNTISCTYEPK